MPDRTRIHTGNAAMGLDLVGRAHKDPEALQKLLEGCTDDEFIGLAAHMMSLQDRVNLVWQMFHQESERRGIEE